MNDPRYAKGIRLFQDGHWFECHEVLELLWRATPRGEVRDYLQGLIQLAVSLEHWRRGNPRGARGQWQKATAKFVGLPGVFEGLELDELVGEFTRLWAEVQLEAHEARQASGEAGALPTPERWPTPRWSSPAG